MLEDFPDAESVGASIRMSVSMGLGDAAGCVGAARGPAWKHETTGLRPERRRAPGRTPCCVCRSNTAALATLQRHVTVKTCCPHRSNCVCDQPPAAQPEGSLRPHGVVTLACVFTLCPGVSSREQGSLRFFFAQMIFYQIKKEVFSLKCALLGRCHAWPSASPSTRCAAVGRQRHHGEPQMYAALAVSRLSGQPQSSCGMERRVVNICPQGAGSHRY